MLRQILSDLELGSSDAIPMSHPDQTSCLPSAISSTVPTSQHMKPLLSKLGKGWCQLAGPIDFMMGDLHEALLTEHPAAQVRNLQRQ